MIIRQLKEQQYQALCQDLRAKTSPEPLAASYTVTMRVDGVEYALRLQPGRNRRMAVLQALRIERGADGPGYQLITKDSLLHSLLELLLYQGVA